MKSRIALVLVFSLILLNFTNSQAQSAREQKVVSPYTIKVFNVTSTGGKGTSEKTLNSQIFANTVYYVEVTTTSSALNIATIRATNCDGYYTGFWNGSSFQLSTDPTIAQKDGNKLTFLIKTFSGVEFFVPLYIKLRECNSTIGTCTIVPTGTGWQNIRSTTFPQ